jgi:predicted ATPase
VLPVRMGLHTGEAELRDGDYFGSTLNRCARLMSIAHGGQIVCSEATAALVRDRDDLRDLGEHRLRDLSRSERVSQIGLGEFGPLRSLGSYPSNLPLQWSSFVGREREVVEVAEALTSHRLVALTGVGGVGKTRLALHVAAEIIDRFDDGCWLVELAPVTDRDALWLAVANALMIPQRQAMSMAESVIDFLKLKKILLLLDNCEHVLSAASSLVASVLRGCAGVVTLVTSREALGVEGEQVIPLRSLSVPESIGDAESSEAVRLFVERAREVRPSFTLTADNASAVVEICDRLDGIPLALELAAARASSLGPGDIARRLSERFRLLTGGRAAALERHQTLRGAVDWSYALLDEPARDVFACLSVFAGGFNLDAATVVASRDGIDEFAVIDILADLVNKSMLVVDDLGDSVRYRLLETLRQYAQERLDASGRTDQLRLRHAEWCVKFARQTNLEFGVDTARLRDEIDNLRAAYQWCRDRDRYDLAIEFVAPLEFPSHLTLLTDIAIWAQELSAVPELETHPLMPALYAMTAISAAYRGDTVTARRQGEAAVRGQQASPGHGLTGYIALALTSIVEGRLQDAIESLETLGRFQAQHHPRWGPIVNSAVLTSLRYRAEKLSAHDAAKVLESLVPAARALPTTLPLALTLMAYAPILESIDPAASERVYEECAQVAAKSLARAPEAAAWGGLLHRYAHDGKRFDAARALRRALDIWVDNGARANLSLFLAQAVAPLHRLGEQNLAAVLVGVVESGPTAGRGVGTHQTRMYGVARADLFSEMGDADFQAAFERGSFMSYEDAIRFVRAEADRMLQQADA